MSITAHNLYKSYGSLQVIQDLKMEFQWGKIHCLFGPSGCGKTTLLQIITGLLATDKGRVEGLRDKKCSYLFQEDRLLPWENVAQNIYFVLATHIDKEQAWAKVEEYLKIVKLERFKNAYPHQLSGGMKQRVALARALAYGGDILVMDEPFKGLDWTIKEELMDKIAEQWRKPNRMVIFVTHDPAEVKYLADQVYILSGPPLAINQLGRADQLLGA